MNNILILIAGIPGGGKSTFAKYLASEWSLPLVSYDHIKSKEWDYIQNSDSKDLLQASYGRIAYDFFWFFIEEVMMTNSPVIVDYIFHPSMTDRIQALVDKYGYRTITGLFDADVKIAYERCIQRDSSATRHAGIAITDMSFEKFEQCVLANKNFKFGDNMIIVNTNSFNHVSYEAIIQQIQKHCT